MIPHPRFLQNDPTGDDAQYGGFIAGLLMFFRWAWSIVLGILLLFLGVAILIFGVMVIQFLLWLPTLFVSDIPFLMR